ncbi:MAG: helix-turn-helix domain-containing protein [Deltaproteobacteria bacterium]
MRHVTSLEELGARLSGARKGAGLTQADLGQRVGLDRTAITKIEAGSRGVDALELSRIASVLERPADWFLSLSPPLVASRRAALDVSNEQGADVQLELLARDVEQLLELGMPPLPNAPRPLSPVRDVEGAEQAANAARAFIERPEGPLKDLLRFAERLGVVGASLDLRNDQLDGSYVALEVGGVALINGAAPPGRRRFTLAHEVGHHVVADSYSAEWVVSTDGEDRERLVNAFAIHFLMPRSSVLTRWKELSGQSDPRRSALTLGAEFGVSWSAVCAHLRHLELITQAAAATLLRLRPSKADYVELELGIEEDMPPPALSPVFAASIVKAYKKHKLSHERALELLRGSVPRQELPAPDVVPLDAMRAELAPLE